MNRDLLLCVLLALSFGLRSSAQEDRSERAVTTTTVTWGHVIGTITNQGDLMGVLSTKADNTLNLSNWSKLSTNVLMTPLLVLNSNTVSIQQITVGGPIQVTGLSDGIVYGAFHSLRSLPNAAGILNNDGNGNLSWKPVVALARSVTSAPTGLTNYMPANDYLLTDNFADVRFSNATLSTPVLPAGTYLVTCMIQCYRFRTIGHPSHIQLYGTETESPIPGTDRWTGPDVNTTSFAGEWPIMLQATVTVTHSGAFKVQARNGVPGDRNCLIRSGASTLSWIKTS